MKLPQVLEVARGEARTTAFKISFCIAVITLIAWILWSVSSVNSRLNLVVDSAEHHLSRMMTIGDIFQLRSQLDSLLVSKSISGFRLFEFSSGFLVVSGGPRASDSWGSCESDQYWRIIRDGTHIYLEKKFLILKEGGSSGCLTVSQSFPLYQIPFVILLLVLIFYLLTKILSEQFRKFAASLSYPMVLLSHRLNENINQDDLRYQELSDVYSSFKQKVTSLKEAEAEKRKLERSAALSELASRVAHDIRSPVAALKIILNRIQGFQSEENEIMQSAIRNIENISNDLLLQRRSSSLPRERLDLKQIVSDSFKRKIIETEACQKNLKWNLNLPEQNFFLLANQSDFERTFSNLLNNAVEAIADQGTISVELRGDRDFYEILIEDSGRGISEDIIPTLLRGGNSQGKYNGNGIGLKQAVFFMKESGGEIFIHSKLSEMTRIALRWRSLL